jgi:hypothetical protein
MKHAKPFDKEYIVGFFTMDRKPREKKRSIRQDVKAALSGTTRVS